MGREMLLVIDCIRTYLPQVMSYDMHLSRERTTICTLSVSKWDKRTTIYLVRKPIFTDATGWYI
jgi:hypothetical protein